MTDRSVAPVTKLLPIEDVQDALARNLTAARSALKLSQDQLAAEAGVSRATVNQLEGGASASGDPRLSTLVNIAAALGVSPVFLLLGRAELDAIAEAPRNKKMAEIGSNLSAEEVETMRRLLRSGVAKNRAKAVEIGTAAATTSGMTAGAIAAAAIGTTLLPGLGTVIGAVLGSAWSIKKLAEMQKDKD